MGFLIPQFWFKSKYSHKVTPKPRLSGLKTVEYKRQVCHELRRAGMAVNGAIDVVTKIFRQSSIAG